MSKWQVDNRLVSPDVLNADPKIIHSNGENESEALSSPEGSRETAPENSKSDMGRETTRSCPYIRNKPAIGEPGKISSPNYPGRRHQNKFNKMQNPFHNHQKHRSREHSIHSTHVLAISHRITLVLCGLDFTYFPERILNELHRLGISETTSVR